MKIWRGDGRSTSLYGSEDWGGTWRELERNCMSRITGASCWRWSFHVLGPNTRAGGHSLGWSEHAGPLLES